jgi:mycothiol synthase
MTRQAVPGIEVAAHDRLSAAQVDEVRRLIDEVEAADGVQPFSDHVRVHLGGPATTDAQNLLAFAGDRLTGFAHVSAPAGGYAPAELAVHPAHRRRGVGTALLSAVIAAVPDGAVQVWAHGQGGTAPSPLAPPTTALSERFGFQRVRSLWQMRADLAGLPPVHMPDGVTIRPFVPGQDEAAWLTLNNLSFASHPEQGGWTEDEVRLREAEDWFDPAGFLLAERADSGLVGFHWTKIHRPDPIGEVYIVGVDPSEAGHGLGKAMTLAGLHYLAGRGLTRVLLYVDEDNTRAVKLYERLDFQRWDTDVSYQREPGGVS